MLLTFGRGVLLSVSKHIIRNIFPKTLEPGEDNTFFLRTSVVIYQSTRSNINEDFNPLNPELNPICYLLALLGAHNFLHVSRIRFKLLTFRLLMSYIYGAPILDVSRSHTTTQHSQ